MKHSDCSGDPTQLIPPSYYLKKNKNLSKQNVKSLPYEISNNSKQPPDFSSLALSKPNISKHNVSRHTPHEDDVNGATALITPADYAIYQKQMSKQASKIVNSKKSSGSFAHVKPFDTGVTVPEDNAPTALIGPTDYKNYFNHKKFSRKVSDLPGVSVATPEELLRFKNKNAHSTHNVSPSKKSSRKSSKKKRVSKVTIKHSRSKHTSHSHSRRKKDSSRKSHRKFSKSECKIVPKVGDQKMNDTMNKIILEKIILVPANAESPIVVDIENLPTQALTPEDYKNYVSAKINAKKTFKKIADAEPNNDACPTALIAPVDYKNYFTKKIIKKKSLDQVEDEALPTALIAPNDYKNFFTAVKKKKQEAPPTADDETLPTALIAPEDYKNFFSKNLKKGKNHDIPKKNEPMDQSQLPTALIAPEDYKNFFSNPKKKPSNDLVVDSKSQLPTTLIGPEDYKNFFCAKKLNKKLSKEINEVQSHIPSALLAHKTEVKNLARDSQKELNGVDIREPGGDNDGGCCCSIS